MCVRAVCSSAKRENYVMRVLSVYESFECSREFRVVFESFEWCSREFRVVFERVSSGVREKIWMNRTSNAHDRVSELPKSWAPLPSETLSWHRTEREAPDSSWANLEPPKADPTLLDRAV